LDILLFLPTSCHDYHKYNCFNLFLKLSLDRFNQAKEICLAGFLCLFIHHLPNRSWSNNMFSRIINMSALCLISCCISWLCNNLISLTKIYNFYRGVMKHIHAAASSCAELQNLALYCRKLKCRCFDAKMQAFWCSLKCRHFYPKLQLFCH
jgi:hypothetical protein